jgi:hypothetical protein
MAASLLLLLLLLRQNGKGKVVSVPFLTENHALKAYWGVDVELHTFFISALDGGEWSVSRPGRFTLRERDHVTHWRGGLMGLRADLDATMDKVQKHNSVNTNTPSSESYRNQIISYSLSGLEPLIIKPQA